MALGHKTLNALAAGLFLLIAACDSPAEREAAHIAKGKELLAAGDPVKAQLEFRNALQINPIGAEATFMLAKIAEDSGDYLAALRGYKAVADQNAGNAEAQLKAGQLELYSGDAVSAVYRADKVLALTPTRLEARTLKAGALRLEGKLDQATKELDAVLAQDPKHADALGLLAEIKLAQGQASLAADLVDRGLQAAPENIELTTLRLTIFRRLQDKTGTHAMLQRLVALRPDNPEYLGNYASELAEEGDLAGARDGSREPQRAGDLFPTGDRTSPVGQSDTYVVFEGETLTVDALHGLLANDSPAPGTLRASSVLVFRQDRALRYTWVANPALGVSEADVLGRTDVEMLGAERLVETRNVAGTVNASTPFMRDFAATKGGMDAVFSEFNLDSAEVVTIPPAKVFTTHLQLGFDPNHPVEMGVSEETVRFYRQGERFAGGLGVQLTHTCTPYQVGNVPTRGEHCAWMESSAVIYCNSVLGARTNTEGRESTGAAMLTGRIPYWGYHLDAPRLGTHRVQVDVPVATTFEWGLLGYAVGEWVQERVPVLVGPGGHFAPSPNLQRLKHFGAAASSSGGVEMYHLVGITPEAMNEHQAFGGRAPREQYRYGAAERQATWERLNHTAMNAPNARDVDYVMLGCPHYNLEQLWEACRLLEGRKVHANSALWIFTPRAIKAVADQNGYTKIIEDAGAVLMSDSCSAMSRAMPPGTKVAALDSAKHAHYLPAITGVQAWFGTTADCIDAACTGKWNGTLS